MSGVGKSTAVEKILSLYPQCICHDSYQGQPLVLTQIVWLKLDCPHDGSIKGLCFQFFEAIDRAMGTDYFPKYTKFRYTVDVLMVLMTQLVNLYQIGILVIDEIQHLSLAKGGGSEKMLNFFVTLVNTIGIPVVMIGTTKAMSILQSEFRQARRGSGQGDFLWDRMHNVKLYAMVRIKTITVGNDSFSAKDFHAAATEKLGLVKPMLDALRTGDKKKIRQYGDTSPVSIEDYLSSYMSMAKEPIPEKALEGKISVAEQAVLKLLELGVEPGTAKRLSGRALAAKGNNPHVADVVREAYYLYIMEGKEMEAAETADGDDLRKQGGYDAMKQKGLIDETEW